jgi:hypothetical protein
VFWVTAGGVSTTPAPLVTAVPGALGDVTLLNVTLPSGASLTNAFFLQNGATTVAADFIAANVE